MTIAQLWNNIVAYALQVGLLVALGAIIPPVLKLQTPRARLLFWQAVLASCVLLPWIQPWRQQVINVSSVKAISTIEISQAAAPSLPDSGVPAAPVPHQIPFTAILLCVLAAGIIVRIALLILGLVRLAGYRRRGRELVSDPVFRMATPTSARWLVSEEISSPVTFGWRDPVVLLPARFPALRAELREVILCHELIHIERRDWMYTVAEEFARAIFWFHPAVWWVLGEIQLAREQTVDQAVMEITHAREHYIDALLTMATSRSPAENQLDLAPAPLFLRRRHLKRRVVELLREVRISPVSGLRALVNQATAIATIATACWLVSGAFPLDATPQFVADAAGVVVDTGDAKLLYRTPVLYPEEAIEKGVQGTVVVDAVVNRDGSLGDDTVVHCARELCDAANDSLSNWRFATHHTQQKILINFLRPPGASAAPVDDLEQDQIWMSRMLAQQLLRPNLNRAKQRVAYQLAQNMTPVPQSSQPTVIFASRTLVLNGEYVMAVPPASTNAFGHTLNQIRVAGLSDSATSQLRSRLPVQPGNVWSPEDASIVNQVAAGFDPSLEVDVVHDFSPQQQWTLWIGPASSPFTTRAPIALPTPPSGVYAGPGNGVIPPTIVTKVDPAYTDGAKSAGTWGSLTVSLIVGSNGLPQNVQVIGPLDPGLDASAVDALYKWRFRPAMKDGIPVSMQVQVELKFRML